MLRIFSLVAALMFAATGATAQDRPVVVELFTSQGCSSCPPADALLHELAGRDDVVALALHVDYWDYIGWVDIFARPAHTDRQRAYAKAKGERMIYTPQMIINGYEHVVGNRPQDVATLIKKHQANAPSVTLELVRDGDDLTINAAAKPGVKGPLVVQLLRYTPEAAVDIKRGENGGRTLKYSNIVTDLEVLNSKWDTRQPLEMVTQVAGDDPIVVLIQHYKHGPIEAAARLR